MTKELAVGDPAPDFELPTDGGGRARLSDLKGKRVVIYFYPKDDTSGCTAEAIAFNGLRARIRRRRNRDHRCVAGQRLEPRQVQAKA